MATRLQLLRQAVSDRLKPDVDWRRNTVADICSECGCIRELTFTLNCGACWDRAYSITRRGASTRIPEARAFLELNRAEARNRWAEKRRARFNPKEGSTT